jgi:hypothetical protein
MLCDAGVIVECVHGIRVLLKETQKLKDILDQISENQLSITRVP